MASGFIGQELYATTSPESPQPSPQPPPTPPPAHVASSQTGPSTTTTYIPLDTAVSEADAAHNTLLVGLLIALVAVSVAFGCLAIYCLRRRAQKKVQSAYRAELRGMQKKDDEERVVRAA